MNNLEITLFETMVGKEHADLLKEYEFRLVLDMDEMDDDSFGCTVVQNKDLLIAFTFQRSDGENLVVAEIGSPINASSIRSRTNGWSLLPEVWSEAYQEYHNVLNKLKEEDVTRKIKASLIDNVIRTFISMVREKELSISNPENRMETYRE